MKRQHSPTGLRFGTALALAALALTGGVSQTIAAVRPHTAPVIHLAGGIAGTWTRPLTPPDTGGLYRLTGGGTVLPLGAVQGSSHLQTPGFIALGKTTGALTLANAQGTLSLSLTGPSQPGGSPPPPKFAYAITGGTGVYKGATGAGYALLTMTPATTTAKSAFTLKFADI